MKVLDLSGTWEMKPVKRFDGNYNESGWVETQVPGHWQMNPLFEFYEGKMLYRRRFEFPQRREGRRYRLRVNGAFYWSIVNLNNARIGENEGYFFPRDYEITDVIERENHLLIELDCPDEKNKNAKRLVTGVFSHWDCLDPKTNPGGIWLPVEIHESADVWLEDPLVHCAYWTDSYLRVEARVTADSTKRSRIKIRVTLSPHNFKGKTHIHEQEFLKTPGKNSYQMLINLDEWELWWTHDLGKSNLYQVKMEVFEQESEEPSDALEFKTGLRTFDLRNWIPYLNGKRMFIRGNNYPPGDTRIATMTKELYEKDFDLIQDANINFMRVHAHVDHPLFYETADERGVLLWQDFPLQWFYVKEVLPTALYQVERMVKILYNHPSIIAWCCHNEPFKIVDASNINAKDVVKSVWTVLGYNWNREVLDKKLKEQVLSVDVTRFVQKSSGFQGIGKEPGDEHFYFGWYPPFGKIRNFDFYAKFFKNSIRFPTEFGAQSFPNYESAVKFMDPDIRKVNWKHLEERHHFQPGMMRRWIRHEEYNSLQDYINATQKHQINVNKFIIDRLRLRKYNPVGGVTAFLFLDSNPAVQWSLVDYWRVPKKSYYSFKISMNPEYAFTILDKDSYKTAEPVSIPVYVVNDSYNNYPETRITVTIRKEGERQEILKKNLQTALEPDMEAKLVDTIGYRFQEAGTHELELKLRYDNKELINTYEVKIE